MSGHASQLAVAAVALASSFAGAALFAQEPGEPIRLEYRATPGCPDERAFSYLVRARTTRARPAWPGEQARTFEVTLAAGVVASGAVTVRDVDEHTVGVRRVQAASCAEAADAVALVVALAVDPHATTSVAAIDAGAATVEADSATDAAPATEPDDTGSDAAADVAAPPPPWPPPTPTHEPIGLFAGADFTASTGVSPSALLGVSPYLGWRSLRVSFLRAGSGTLDVPDGTARFTWTVGRVDACPWSLSLGPVRGSACARIESGVLEAAGVSISSPQTHKSAWLALGPVARAEWTLVGPLFLDADLAALVRVTDDRFYFLPSATVDSVPLVGFTGEVGLGVSFP